MEPLPFEAIFADPAHHIVYTHLLDGKPGKQAAQVLLTSITYVTPLTGSQVLGRENWASRVAGFTVNVGLKEFFCFYEYADHDTPLISQMARTLEFRNHLAKAWHDALGGNAFQQAP